MRFQDDPAISTIHSPLRYRGQLSDFELSIFLGEVACSMLGVELLITDAAVDHTMTEHHVAG